MNYSNALLNSEFRYFKNLSKKIQNIDSTVNRNYSTNISLPKCNFIPKPYEGLPLEKLKQIRKTNLNPALTTYYSSPIAFSQGYKQWLFDINGKRYLDMFGGICTVSVGHCHPKITEAVSEQMGLLGHVSNVYFHTKIHEYAQKLADKFPGDLKVVYFVNSGSEANELALLMARSYTQHHEVISLKNGYHGMCNLTMNVTALSNYKYPTPQANGIHHVMNPDVYRGIWGGSNCRPGPVQTFRKCSCKASECFAKDKYVEQFLELFDYSLPKTGIAALIAESMQGIGGVVQYPKGYLKDVAEIVRKNGGLFIADEVQTGFGRTGDHYWGFEMNEVMPDMVTLAKGIGNGFPLGAVVTTPKIAKALSQAAHFNTFGGNPLACAAGIATLDIIDEERLQENSKEVGTYFLLLLEELRREYPIVGDVRGKGLMIGVELVKGDGSTAPLSQDKFMKFWEHCLELGLIFGRGGIYGTVMRIKPPMCVTEDDADFTVAVIREALEKINKYEDPIFVSGV